VLPFAESIEHLLVLSVESQNFLLQTVVHKLELLLHIQLALPLCSIPRDPQVVFLGMHKLVHVLLEHLLVQLQHRSVTEVIAHHLLHLVIEL
jgi:hypothetical protein